MIGLHFKGQKFPFGQLVSTSNALDRLVQADVWTAIQRHAKGDWGDLCEEDRKSNEWSLEHGERLFSVYHDRNQTKFYIITECDRTATTVLLPEDY